jgi:hypothetical protein
MQDGWVAKGRLNAWSYNYDMVLSRDGFGSAIVAR